MSNKQDALTSDAIKKIYQHAESTYPEECCGFVFASGTVHQGINIQNQLHEQDPTKYPRTAKNGYSLSFEDIQILNKSFDSDNKVVVIYHSHPDAGAYFSEEDTKQALFAGEPIYDVAYLVVETRNGMAEDCRLFQFNQGGFVDVPLINLVR
ncbi:Mov34/MPN/PAD-1 family protein [Spartinivicinus ruber]|uniref:Mov34/MPN/PAD-1 family protein n=1 Tax=Spartinivicinus ruber TaxID=2683272 RepID=UPI0013D2F658|nr:Mov34/MPN/PAD-1 family protein [Spartinivicinus ruber]